MLPNLFFFDLRKDRVSMADPGARFQENQPGRFFVDRQCIDCDACRSLAPDFFTRQDVAGHSYVYRQPTDAKEIEWCRKALEECPVNAIGEIPAAGLEAPETVVDTPGAACKG
jgi:ferredoxin